MVCFCTLTRIVTYRRNAKGNRSPIADPRMRGSIVGLTLVSLSEEHFSFPNIHMCMLSRTRRYTISRVNMH